MSHLTQVFPRLPPSIPELQDTSSCARLVCGRFLSAIKFILMFQQSFSSSLWKRSTLVSALLLHFLYTDLILFGSLDWLLVCFCQHFETRLRCYGASQIKVIINIITITAILSNAALNVPTAKKPSWLHLNVYSSSNIISSEVFF